MFPGYGASKDTLLRAALEFHALGCEAWIVDFSGVGDSDGRTTTIGWREAEDVAATVHGTQKPVEWLGIQDVGGTRPQLQKRQLCSSNLV